MIRSRLNHRHLYLRLITLFLPALAFAMAAYVRFFLKIVPVSSASIDPLPYFGLLLFAMVVWALVSEHYRLCHVEQVFAAGGKTKRTFLACGVTYLAVLTATFFYRGTSFSRLFVALSVLGLLVLTLTTRLIFRVIWDRRRRLGSNCIRILIVGADEHAKRAAHSVIAGQAMPCKIVGFVRLSDQQTVVTGAPVHEIDDIEKLAVGNGIDDVIVAIPPSRFAEISAIANKLDPLCVPLRVILDLGDGVFVRENILDFGGISLLDLQSTPAESLMYSVLKRGFDIAFSLFVIALTTPLTFFIAVGIRLTSPGPVLFAQERVGLNGQIFRMYKFRTMWPKEDNESDTRWTTADDPRRTTLGRLLRRMSLDELPQFFNVLKGNMSVVGPRPERPYFVQKFLQDISKYNSRHYLKAGITGWAQVNGWRGDTSIARRVEYDLYYLRHWTFSFDLQIILLTLIRGLSGKNAY